MQTYKTKGVCPREIIMDLDGDTVRSVEFVGGCNGNLKALSKVVQGMTIDEVSALFEGTTCGNKDTSCVDQLVRGLKETQG